MILSKNYKDINSTYDFYEGIITNICWDENLIDLLVTVYYYFDDPKGCKNSEVVIRFKNCFEAKFDCKNAMISRKKLNLDKIFSEIDAISIEDTDTVLHIVISSNFTNQMIVLSCDEVWLEKNEV